MSRSPLPPDVADDFETLRAGPVRAVVRHGFQEAFEAFGLLESASPSRAAEWASGGRGEAWIAEPAAGPAVVVRPGRRGGWFGRLVRRRYFVGDRFVDELVLTERLRRRGAPVPEPLAAVRRERAIGYETWIVTRRLEDAEPAAEALRRAGTERIPALLRAMGRAVRALHEAGGDHADLNAWNVLLVRSDADPKAWIVDLDRGLLVGPPLPRPRARRNLARLRRSLRKLDLGDALAEWSALERGYASPEA